jgi:NAD(P)-dependent dehydrogenase (short-subunit alcohol dehydrogenase family)
MPTVLITGAGRGLGLEFARQYAADGWHVIACVRNPDKAEALKKIKGEVTVERLDVVDESHIKALAGRLKGQSIDLLINNAGIYGPRGGHNDTKSWLEVFNVNAIAPYHLVQALAPLVAKSKHKTIVNITSQMGSVASTSSADSPVYRSSKAALNMVMKGLSNGLKDQGVTVVLFHPGWVKTDMGGSGAPLEAPQSIGAMRKVIAGLSAADTGKFFNYDGKPLPW